MQNQTGNFNPREMFESLRQFLGSTLINNSSVVSPTISADARKRAVLSVLRKHPQNLAQLEQSVRTASAGSFSPKASEISKILEEAGEAGQVSSKAKGDRRIFSLTDAGEAFLNSPEPSSDSAEANSANDQRPRSTVPFSIDPVVIAGAKLATAVTAIAQDCNQTQKEQAAAVLDETRRKLYAILAKD
jgi:DNA-binding PadR family transcriptional regulator